MTRSYMCIPAVDIWPGYDDGYFSIYLIYTQTQWPIQYFSLLYLNAIQLDRSTMYAIILSYILTDLYFFL